MSFVLLEGQRLERALTAEEGRGQCRLVEALFDLADAHDVRKVEHCPVGGAEQMQAHLSRDSLVA